LLYPEQPDSIEDLKPHLALDFNAEEDPGQNKGPLKDFKERMYLVVRSLKKDSKKIVRLLKCCLTNLIGLQDQESRYHKAWKSQVQS
jgi:hypothetical protein